MLIGIFSHCDCHYRLECDTPLVCHSYSFRYMGCRLSLLFCSHGKPIFGMTWNECCLKFQLCYYITWTNDLGWGNASMHWLYRFMFHRLNLTFIRIVYLMQKHFWCKKVLPSKVESYLEVNTWADCRQEDLISECSQGSAHLTQTLH